MKDVVAAAVSVKSSLQRRAGRIGGWDQMPGTSGDVHAQLSERLHAMQPSTLVSKKRREVYFGNLDVKEVNGDVIQKKLQSLFEDVPEFCERYPDKPQVVMQVGFPAGGAPGTFAFVEMFDEVLASTVVLMSGIDMFGRPVKIGRPQGYEMPLYGELAPLNVAPLVAARRIPSSAVFPATEGVHYTSVNESRLKARELYFGNLHMEHANEETLRALLLPVCEQLPEYKAEIGPAIVKVNMAPSNMYAFVQFQSEEMALQVMGAFDQAVLFGRPVKVRRPANYLNESQMAGSTALCAQVALLPPPPPPAALPMPPPPALGNVAAPPPPASAAGVAPLPPPPALGADVAPLPPHPALADVVPPPPPALVPFPPPPPPPRALALSPSDIAKEASAAVAALVSAGPCLS